MLSCNRFQPTLLNGRICYSHKQELGKGTKQGKKHGLLLMIDPGQFEQDQDEDQESSSFKITSTHCQVSQGLRQEAMH